jgi:hypothetical protein
MPSATLEVQDASTVNLNSEMLLWRTERAARPGVSDEDRQKVRIDVQNHLSLVLDRIPLVRQAFWEGIRGAVLLGELSVAHSYRDDFHREVEKQLGILKRAQRMIETVTQMGMVVARAEELPGVIDAAVRFRDKVVLSWETPADLKSLVLGPHHAEMPSDLEEQFRELTERWHKETGAISSVTEILNHPAYLAIIGMGEQVLPLLLRELRDRPALWFKALKAITRQTPVPASDRSNPKRAREAWLQWGQEKGLIR